MLYPGQNDGFQAPLWQKNIVSHVVIFGDAAGRSFAWSPLELDCRCLFLKALLSNLRTDTKVGNEYVRGVSGGEKKRVSIAEAMITKASIQTWDNSTRGLDASTALEYVSSLRSLTNAAGVSTAVALYQAGEQLYDLFDKVLLIDEGRCCYFGPAENAKQYFLDLGFVSPNRWTTADFLTSTTDPHERHVKEGWEDRIPRSADQFGDIFAKSEQNKRNLAEIAEFEQETQLQIEERQKAMSKATTKKNYTIVRLGLRLALGHVTVFLKLADIESSSTALPQAGLGLHAPSVPRHGWGPSIARGQMGRHPLPGGDRRLLVLQLANDGGRRLPSRWRFVFLSFI